MTKKNTAMITEKIIDFKNPVLFLEFFVRDYVFYGKGTVRTKLPPDAFFYIGESKAINRSNPPFSLLGFDNNIPYLSNNISDGLKIRFSERIQILWHLSDVNRLISKIFGDWTNRS